MKKIYPLFCVLFCTSIAFSQNKLSVYSGLNLSHFNHRYIKDSPISQSKLGVNMGLKLNMPINNDMVLETGVGLSMRGTGINLSKTFTDKANVSEGYIRSTLFYVDVPLLLKVYAGSFHLLTGPYLGVNLGGKKSYDYTIDYLNPNEQDKEASGTEQIGVASTYPNKDVQKTYFKPIDYGLVFGFGFELNKIDLRLSYYYGLVNINLPNPKGNEPQDNYRITNKMVSFTVLYKLGKTKSAQID